ncbi:hypothetical protein PYW07_014484 [Mythimna separata]|uniref:Uncharacterized protein n=1 Tax=Mythimna separata TaxID=271217 RepID=A0AAD7Z0N9_MYTSE|nr:hypothetical protein PYW07_014484 [Mythimna separata]
MRVLFIVMLLNTINDIRAEFDIINEDLGDIHLYAEVGKLPLKYHPLSEDDQKASDKGAEVFDFIQLVPKIDPLVVPVIKALSIDVPFLWLSGKVHLENLTVNGVKQVELNNLELRLINLRSDLNITIPQLYIEADFNVRAKLSFMPIVIDCHVSANLYDVGVVVAAGGDRVQAKAGEVLQIESVAINIDIRDVVFNVSNLVIGEKLEDYEEDFGVLSPLFSNRFGEVDNKAAESKILNGLLSSALAIANKELFNVPIAGFMEYLLSDTY